MNNKSKNLLFQMSYLLVIIGAFIATSWYTSDLEMLWLVAFLIVPVWAVVFGFVVSVTLKLLTKSDIKGVIWVVVFSLVIHTGLMVEEISVGAIKNTFDNRAKVLNDEERSRSIHEVNLGEGKSLYFTSNNDTEFQR